jgi:hypothetical protein
MATGSIPADTTYRNPRPHHGTCACTLTRYPQRVCSHAHARNPRIADIRGHAHSPSCQRGAASGGVAAHMAEELRRWGRLGWASADAP